MALRKLKNLMGCRQVLRHNILYNGRSVPLRDIRCLGEVPGKDVFRVKKVMTWNIQELFWYLSPGKLDNVLNYLLASDCDVICLQEVFESNSLERIINDVGLRKKFPFFATGDLRSKYILGEGSGLLVLSVYPIRLSRFVPLAGMEFPDSFASKGILYFAVGGCNFATTHLQSENQKLAGYQLLYLLYHSPFGRDFILLGDLNHEQAERVLRVSRTNTFITHESNRILDYILPLGDRKVRVHRDSIDLTNCSDHYPLIGVFEDGEKKKKTS